MLFCSLEYIFIFFPIVFFVYFYITSKYGYVKSKIFLLCSSLLFYSYWKLIYLPLLLFSIAINYIVGITIIREKKYKKEEKNKLILTVGIIFNTVMLLFFKYTDFILYNFYSTIQLSNSNRFYLNLVLPLGISFFTFQQLAFIIDCYQQKSKQYNFIDYSLFVSFFPQLIAGPIVHHNEIMPQFNDKKNSTINFGNVYIGFFIFIAGLFKKVFIADILSTWVDSGFSLAKHASLIDAWITSINYTFQIYFDFSGYCDMALGSALMLNIHLPINFNSPYKSVSIQEFWRKWHITLSRWLRDYIYIPLGGRNTGEAKIYLNIFITFIICGIWHGAGWTFILWGALHALAIAIHRIWRKFKINIGSKTALIITFLFINCSWIIFRSDTIATAVNLYQAMIGLNGLGFDLHNIIESTSSMAAPSTNSILYIMQFQSAERVVNVLFIIFSGAVVFLAPNCAQIAPKMSISISNGNAKRYHFLISILLGLSFARLFSTAPSPFLYFNF